METFIKYSKIVIFAILFTSLTIQESWLKIIDTPTKNISEITLAFLFALIVFILFDARQKDKTLKNIENIVNDDTNFVRPKEFKTSEEAFSYMTFLFSIAKRTIDQVAIAPTPNIKSQYLNDYDSAIRKVINEKNVEYRLVAEFNRNRWKRISQHIDHNGKNNGKLIVKHYPVEKQNISRIPTMNFIIIDKDLPTQEVLMRCHYDDGVPIFISVKNEYIIKVFQDFFNIIWNKAKLLERNELDDKYLI